MCGICTDDPRAITLSILMRQLLSLDYKIVKAELKGDIVKYEFQKRATSIGIARILKSMLG